MKSRGQLAVAFLVGMLAVGALLLGLQSGAQAAPVEAPVAQATREVLTPTLMSRSPGVTATWTAAITPGHAFNNDGMTWFEVKNDYTDTVTVTFDIPVLVDGIDVPDLEVPVISGTEKMFGPFPPETYNHGGSGADRYRVYVDYSEVTSVTVGVYRLK